MRATDLAVSCIFAALLAACSSAAPAAAGDAAAVTAPDAPDAPAPDTPEVAVPAADAADAAPADAGCATACVDVADAADAQIQLDVLPGPDAPAAVEPEACDACAGSSYPDCVQVNGAWSCVECTKDATCAAKNLGTCLKVSYTCSGSIEAPPNVKPLALCKSDADCVNGPQTQFTLKCDLPTGTCYDVTGLCDNIVAFCNANAGSLCEFPGTPFSGPGSCTCVLTPPAGGMKPECTTGPLAAILKQSMPNCTDAACLADPNTADCTAALGSCCLYAGGKVPPPICGNAGTPSPMCYGGLCITANCLAYMMGGPEPTYANAICSGK